MKILIISKAIEAGIPEPNCEARSWHRVWINGVQIRDYQRYSKFWTAEECAIIEHVKLEGETILDQLGHQIE